MWQRAKFDLLLLSSRVTDLYTSERPGAWGSELNRGRDGEVIGCCTVHYTVFLPPASAVEVIKTVSSVCVCGCVCVCLVQRLTLMISWDRFDGQGHRSKVKVTRSKNVISKISWLECQNTKHWSMMLLWCYATSCYVTIWRRNGMWRHRMTSQNYSSQMKAIWTREVQLSVLVHKRRRIQNAPREKKKTNRYPR